jgi:hypothetical protein
LGRIIPLLGRAKRKKRSKDLLFIALMAEEIEASSKQITTKELQLPHVDMGKSKNIYVDYNTKLREQGITDTVDLSLLNATKDNAEIIVKPVLRVDPLDEEGLEL